MKPRISNLIWGLLFVILGIGFAGNAFGYWNFTLFFAGWWTLFIIVPCLVSIIQDGPNTGTIIGLLIGLMLLLTRQNIVDGELIGKLIVPIIFVIIGFAIMFANSFRGHRPTQSEYTKMKDGNRHYNATFSGQNIHCDNEIFEGASIDAVFGSVALRLDQAIINEDVIINCNATFGGVEIYLPSDVNVKISSTPIFGGVSNKRRNFANPTAPTVYISATCMFGGVDIK
ncbi:MAG: LiaF domain-containing protein [Velocimicrobium sp.]